MEPVGILVGGSGMSMKQILSHSTWICWKDLLEFSRSKIRLVMLILMPLFMMLMVGFIFPSNNSINDQPVAIANQDAGHTMVIPPKNISKTFHFGSDFITGLNIVNNKTGMMKLSNAKDFSEIKDRIDKGDISGGIIIPANFSSNIIAGRQGYITVITDQSNPQISSIMASVLTGTIKAMGSQMAMYNLNQTYHIDINKTVALIQPYSITTSGTVSNSSNYFEFVAPGIIAMTVMMSLMTGLPHAISYEKDMGTLDGMLVAPINRLSIILGKVMAQTIRGLVQAFIIFVLAILLFGVVIYGNILLVVALVILSVFSFVGLGILITSFTDKEETATMVMMTLMFPMMFLSGVFFPIGMMPWYMQDIAHILPLTYAATALRKVIVLGAGLSAVWVEVAVLVGVGIVFLAIAVPMFKKAMTR